MYSHYFRNTFQRQNIFNFCTWLKKILANKCQTLKCQTLKCLLEIFYWSSSTAVQCRFKKCLWWPYWALPSIIGWNVIKQSLFSFFTKKFYIDFKTRPSGEEFSTLPCKTIYSIVTNLLGLGLAHLWWQWLVIFTMHVVDTMLHNFLSFRACLNISAGFWRSETAISTVCKTMCPELRKKINVEIIVHLCSSTVWQVKKHICDDVAAASDATTTQMESSCVFVYAKLLMI